MNKIFTILFAVLVLNLNAQTYSFSKSTGTYSNLSGSTVIANGTWTAIEKGITSPFTYKYWGVDMTDSIYVDDYGSISVNDGYGEEISFLNEDLTSKGSNLSPVSYTLEGTSPNRIFKLEFKNVGFDLDLPNTDYANVQCWIYETTNVIEFRYGPNSVKSSSWSDNGAFVGIIDEAQTKFVILESNPANPTVNKTDILNAATLNGMPASGTIYKFTPSNGSNINSTFIKINVAQNKISVPSSLIVKSIKIYSVSGQLIQSGSEANDIDFSLLNQGLYIVTLETSEGLISQKLVL